MESVIEDYLRSCDLTTSHMEASFSLSLTLSGSEKKHLSPAEQYLERPSLNWSLIHRPRSK